ncbi:MAG: hypothetical protein K9L78_01045 [Victivallales bacterium]|nr:hypothetical protein [Victivallales bacterium]MCF7888683.1 hypothetical protein [Victivallales bacterium]
MKSNSLINSLLLNPVNWLNEDQKSENILLYSRINLSRNISNINFPVNCSETEKKQVLNTVKVALRKISSKEFIEININELEDIDINFLLERKLISNQLAASNGFSYLVFNEKENLQLMVNEENHLKIQLIRPGNSLREIWKKISNFENKLGRIIPFSFDKTLGYKTSSPLEVGTGMKASVMLNLPGLALANQIESVIKGINKLGLTVNGFYGENSSYIGNLYEITNQSTLGVTEEKIIEKIDDIAHQIVLHEKNARQNLIDKKKEFFLNSIGRAYGILRYSYILTAKEAFDYLSLLRMGVDLKMFNRIDFRNLNHLLISIQNAHLRKYTGINFKNSNLDTIRADLVRNRLQN